jgi:hypothetical protein
MKTALRRRLYLLARLAIAGSLSSLFSVSSFGTSYALGGADGSNLRQIAKAKLIYAQDHQGRFPAADDIWDDARILAEAVGLEEGNVWQSRVDPASAESYSRKLKILLPKKKGRPRELNPDFRQIKPVFAVALGKMHTNRSATTPIAWTRGLQPDGTWAKHSPYGELGGHIVFLGGNVAFYRNLTDDGGQLIRPDGTKTANILEALPVGSRISEYMPTAAEQETWSNSKRDYFPYSPISRSLWPPLPFWIFIWVPFVGVSIYRHRKNKAGVFSIFIWPALITLLLFILNPTVSH